MNTCLAAHRVTNKQGVCLSEPVTTGGEVFSSMKYKTPEEAGIARIPHPTAKRRRPKSDPSRRKWITKGEAQKLGYNL